MDRFAGKRGSILAISLAVSGSVQSPAYCEGNACELRRISDVSFLSGHWTATTSSGAIVEEYWSKPEGDSMVGHCRMIKDGHTTFFELLTISKTPTGLVLRMRHFDGELTPWPQSKESGDCRLVQASEQEAMFSNGKPNGAIRVTYRRTAPDTLTALVEDTHDNQTDKHSFEYKLAR